MAYAFDMLVLVAAVTGAALVAASVALMRGARAKRKALLQLLAGSVCWSPVAGLMIGALETHGIGIPALLFGGVVSFLAFVVAATVVVLWPARHAQAT